MRAPRLLIGLALVVAGTCSVETAGLQHAPTPPAAHGGRPSEPQPRPPAVSRHEEPVSRAAPRRITLLWQAPSPRISLRWETPAAAGRQTLVW